MAIQKADGLWCNNKALKVKRAEFQKPGQMEKRVMNRDEEGTMMQQRQGSGVKKSSAEALQIVKASESEKVVIKAYEEGNGCLYESLIVKLDVFFSFKDFRAELCNRGIQDMIARDREVE